MERIDKLSGLVQLLQEVDRRREHRFINLGQPRGRAVLQRTTTTTTTRQRQGINTRVVPRIDRESQGDRVVSRMLIPFIRARNVSFDVTGMKPYESLSFL